MGESLLPYVQNEHKKYDEKKTWKLIEQLTEYARLYMQYDRKERYKHAAEAGLSEEYIQDTIQAGAEMLPGQKYSVEKFLQSYLYCATSYLRSESVEEYRECIADMGRSDRVGEESL